MVKLVVRYLNQYRDRHSQERIYFRRTGFESWPLRGPVGSIEFWEDYNAAAAGETPPGVFKAEAEKPKQAPRVQAESLRWLCDLYKKSAGYKQLDKDSTRPVRDNTIERLCGVDIDGTAAGDLPFARMRRRHVLRIRDGRAETPEAANALVKLLRELFKVALDQELVEFDPTYQVPLLKSKNPDGHIAWTVADFQRYEETHPIGTMARLTLDLMIYTDQRISDVARLGRQHETDRNWLRFTQFKGRKKKPVTLSIPIIAPLRASIDATDTGDLTYIKTAFGRSFTTKGLGNRFRKWCDAAGLHHCSAHGVRKGAAAWFAEMGLTNQMLKALGGWQTDKEVTRYTASADQKHLAAEAGQIIEACLLQDENGTKVPNLGAGGQKVRQ